MRHAILSANVKQLPSPSFVMVEELLERNLKTLQMIQEASGAAIICALKGFAMYSTFPLVKTYLAGTTASSLHEARLGYETFGHEVHAYSPAYIPSEFEQILSYCNHITFNSLSEWKRYQNKIQSTERSISCGLRINPEYSEVETDFYNPCVKGSRLGITAKYLGDTLPEGIEGLHMHTLCENSAETLDRTLQALEERFGHLLHQAKWLNLGGGHAITRKGYDIELLIHLIQNLKENYNLQVILEPGSAVAWETGYLVSTVLDIVENDGVTTAMLDTSFAAHMPDCLEMPYKPHILQENAEGAYKYALGGTTCLAGDQIPGFRFAQPLKAGDTLIFNDMMHYTMVKTNTFNGVNLPAIGILKKDSTFELVKSFGYEDYKTRLS